MKVRNIPVLIFIGVFSLAVVACTRERREDPAQKQAAQSQAHGAGDKTAADVGLVEVLKGKSLSGHSSTSIGRAFDGYGHFSKKEWKESRAANGKVFIDFTGWFDANSLDSAALKDKVSARGNEVKFVIYPNGEFAVVMVSKVEMKADGQINRYPLGDSKDVLDAIYANRKINP